MPPHPLDLELPKHVDAALAGYLADRRSLGARMEENFGGAVDALADFVLGGGKRVRPTFAWWGWRAAGGDPDGPLADAVLTAVSSLELIQACALIHDDLMDASETRRGMPTVHVRFARRHREQGWLGEPERFGLAASVLIGDVALAWADDMLFAAGLPNDALRRLSLPWRDMRTEMLAGQYLDVLTQARGDSSADAALRIDRLKTAAYTVERPLHMGAAIGDAPPGLVDGLRTFGADIGVAFQLRDDLLGVFGDPAVTGKPAGDDLREGKRTLLVALGMRYGADLLHDALGRPDLDAATVDAVRAGLVEVGAVAAVEERIAALTASALAALDRAPVVEPVAAERLAELAVSATKRTH
ncbi:polyprenyl synthetase family protein [Saccharothrix algeriensis]|uniref:Geranylgeranyl diphosphate synthase type I n=1 Tax=Saccharothrix algeriensis TaxID=173560 RepID=A0A8T8I1V0_9PSEU|nr:polyprenyl synthetase family protein [Saccharothrix algeriensis]MBM7810766.1 geranylgeranyl diphosphate synthase type I [Saccharothrix algeriensis]QTR04812.1 polyprenyl synthetase family protein [Saccharothrix algeriensis]